MTVKCLNASFGNKVQQLLSVFNDALMHDPWFHAMNRKKNETKKQKGKCY